MIPHDPRPEATAERQESQVQVPKIRGGEGKKNHYYCLVRVLYFMGHLPCFLTGYNS